MAMVRPESIVTDAGVPTAQIETLGKDAVMVLRAATPESPAA